METAVEALQDLDGIDPTPTPTPIPEPSPTSSPSPEPTQSDPLNEISESIAFTLHMFFRDLRSGTSSIVIFCSAPCANPFGQTITGLIDLCHNGHYGVETLRAMPGNGTPNNRKALDDLEQACTALERATRNLGEPTATDEWLHAANTAKLIMAPYFNYPAKFAFGDHVVVETGSGDRMIVRERPGTTWPELSRAENGIEFIIADGPIEADGYYWWRFESGGWAADANLVAAGP
jgi:hypothetical protein